MMDEDYPTSFPRRMCLVARNYLSSSFHSIRKVHRYNQRTLRKQPLQEISGAFGDLGTLLPILIALSDHLDNSRGSIDLSTTLVLTGIFNILTGALFGIPLPVQPMKAIAAVAIAKRYDQETTASAGLFTAGVIGLLSLTGLLQWFTQKIPVPVIKGIQIGTGLSLIISAGKMLNPGSGIENYGRFIFFALFLAATTTGMLSRVPIALIMLLLTVVYVLPDAIYFSDHWHFWNPHGLLPSPQSFITGALNAGLGQIPLTVLNSIIAIASFSADLLPEVDAPSVTSLGLSVTGMNLLSCWFGSMPVCHGSGGLAAQYRFGARSGASIIFLGTVKLLVGLFAKDYVYQIFFRFPQSILGLLLFVAGLELAKVGESVNTTKAPDIVETHGCLASDFGGKMITELTHEEKQRRWAIMILTAGGMLGFRNPAEGFLTGMLCHWGFKLEDWRESRRSHREGQIRLDNESQMGHTAPLIQDRS